MQPVDRMFPTYHPKPPGKMRRRHRHPVQALHIQLLPQQESSLADQITQPIPLSALSEKQAQETHIYEHLDTALSEDLLNVNEMSDMRLMQISGAIRAIQLQPSTISPPLSSSLVLYGEQPQLDGPQYLEEVPSWPAGSADPYSTPLFIQPIDKTICIHIQKQKLSFWKRPQLKMLLTLLAGIGLLAFIARFINMNVAMRLLQQHLTTPRGILHPTLPGHSLNPTN